MSEHDSRWVAVPDDETAFIRKPERKGKPKLAQYDNLDARIAEINSHALARWQETRAA